MIVMSRIITRQYISYHCPAPKACFEALSRGTRSVILNLFDTRASKISSCRSSFPNTHITSTLYLVPLLWQFFSRRSSFFDSYVLGHLILHLSYNGFPFTWVEISWLTHLECIWFYACAVRDFFSRESGFLDSRVLGAFGPMTLPWEI